MSTSRPTSLIERLHIWATLAVLIALLPATAPAWDFSPTPVCTLRHAEGDATVTVTHDPSRTDPFAIALTLPAPWPDTPVFAIRFDGARPLEISTSRHGLSDDRRTLTVTDKGFGNVLNGLEFNVTATALAQDVAQVFSLAGAPPEVREFRACAAALST